MSQPTRDIKGVINQFLFDYCTTPHTAKLESPAKLFFNREIHNRFNLIRPPTTVETIEKNQTKQVEHHKARPLRDIPVGSSVWLRYYSNPNVKTWTKRRIRQILGQRNFLVQLDKSGRTIKRHVDQIRSAANTSSKLLNNDYESYNDGQRERDLERGRKRKDDTPPTTNSEPASSTTIPAEAIAGGSTEPVTETGAEAQSPWCPTRVRRKPDRRAYQ